MTFILGATSLRNLEGCNTALVSFVKALIAVSPVDFGILDGGGFRTAEYQHHLYQQGRTAPGSIVTQKDGSPGNESVHQSGLAVDLVPYVDKVFSWNWEYIYSIIAAAAVLAEQRKMVLRWGGVWDRNLNDLDPTKLPDAVHQYTIRHKGSDLLDGPHIEKVK